jgi:DNA-binding NtrC family response regulator
MGGMIVASFRPAILVVEDEVLIRISIAQELEDAGFEVFEAEDAHAAIAILEKYSHIHVMFSDVDMPGGLDGLRLAELVRGRWPPIKIIITSGHRNLTNVVAHYIEKILPKPYTPEKVVSAIRELVDHL